MLKRGGGRRIRGERAPVSVEYMNREDAARCYRWAGSNDVIRRAIGALRANCFSGGVDTKLGTPDGLFPVSSSFANTVVRTEFIPLMEQILEGRLTLGIVTITCPPLHKQSHCRYGDAPDADCSCSENSDSGPGDDQADIELSEADEEDLAQEEDLRWAPGGGYHAVQEPSLMAGGITQRAYVPHPRSYLIGRTIDARGRVRYHAYMAPVSSGTKVITSRWTHHADGRLRRMRHTRVFVADHPTDVGCVPTSPTAIATAILTRYEELLRNFGHADGERSMGRIAWVRGVGTSAATGGTGPVTMTIATGDPLNPIQRGMQMSENAPAVREWHTSIRRVAGMVSDGAAGDGAGNDPTRGPIENAELDRVRKINREGERGFYERPSIVAPVNHNLVPVPPPQSASNLPEILKALERSALGAFSLAQEHLDGEGATHASAIELMRYNLNLGITAHRGFVRTTIMSVLQRAYRDVLMPIVTETETQDEGEAIEEMVSGTPQASQLLGDTLSSGISGGSMGVDARSRRRGDRMRGASPIGAATDVLARSANEQNVLGADQKEATSASESESESESDEDGKTRQEIAEELLQNMAGDIDLSWRTGKYAMFRPFIDVEFQARSTITRETARALHVDGIISFETMQRLQADSVDLSAESIDTTMHSLADAQILADKRIAKAFPPPPDTQIPGAAQASAPPRARKAEPSPSAPKPNADKAVGGRKRKGAPVNKASQQRAKRRKA